MSSRSAGTPGKPTIRTTRASITRSTSTSARSPAATGRRACRPGAPSTCASPSIPARTSRGETGDRGRDARAARQNRFLANSPPEVVYNGFQAEGYVLEGGERRGGAARRAHEEVRWARSSRRARQRARPMRASSASMPAFRHGLRPHAENIHGFDERVELGAVRQCTQAMALFVAEWCGVEAVREPV